LKQIKFYDLGIGFLKFLSSGYCSKSNFVSMGCIYLCICESC